MVGEGLREKELAWGGGERLKKNEAEDLPEGGGESVHVAVGKECARQVLGEAVSVFGGGKGNLCRGVLRAGRERSLGGRPRGGERDSWRGDLLYITKGGGGGILKEREGVLRKKLGRRRGQSLTERGRCVAKGEGISLGRKIYEKEWGERHLRAGKRTHYCRGGFGSAQSAESASGKMGSYL